MKIPLAPSGLRNQDIEVVIDVLNSGNLTMGEEVKQFEIEMARYLRVENFIMMNSGSSANLAILESLVRPSKRDPLLKSGDRVLVPIIAWPTTIWPLIQNGLIPHFVDIDPNSLAMDLGKAQIVIDDNNFEVKALFPIHPLGYGINNRQLNEFATKNNLILIEDMCESLGSWQGSKHSGTGGLMSSYSFYFSHHITTMEGGGVATNDEEFADDLRSIRSHGWSRDRRDNQEWSFEIHPSLKKFNFVSTGFNVRPMEIQAAIGRSQLRALEEFISRRRENVSKVHQALKGSSLRIIGLADSVDCHETTRHSWMHIPIQVLSPDSENDRLKIIRFLEDAGIETRPPLTGNFLNQPAMARFAFQQSRDFPVANEITTSTFLVGCHHDLSSTQIEYLANRLKLASTLISQ